MGLQINTNVAALNAYRNLSGTQSSMQTSLERLSSGLRINRAADDAAGLAISEKLRSQVSGLNQAQANAQDGVSLIQTAEGALNETHAILQRMRTLAVQASSDTNTADDRRAIQLEINALVKEVDDTTNRTEFNGMKLLDGTFVSKSLQIGANQSQAMFIQINKMDSDGLGLLAQTGHVQNAATSLGSGTLTGDVKAGVYTVSGATTNLKVVDAGGAEVGSMSSDGMTANLYDGTSVSFTGAAATGNKFEVARASFTATNTTGGTVTAYQGAVPGGNYTFSGGKVYVGTDTTAATGIVAGTVGTDTKTVTFNSTFGGGSMTFTSAVNAATGALTITSNAGAAPLSLATRDAAVASLKTIDNAIGNISQQRAQLGALQNRLDHTVKNLGVSAENLAASESRIRDTDMAKEMTNFTRSQILQQAGVSMLAQANQSSQSVLKLLG